MKNAYAQKLQDIKAIKSKSIRDGMMAMSLITLLAADNILRDYFENEDDISKIMKELDAEIGRVYDEVMASVPNGEVSEMTDLIVGHADEIRTKYKMEALNVS